MPLVAVVTTPHRQKHGHVQGYLTPTHEDEEGDEFVNGFTVDVVVATPPDSGCVGDGGGGVRTRASVDPLAGRAVAEEVVKVSRR